VWLLCPFWSHHFSFPEGRKRRERRSSLFFQHQARNDTPHFSLHGKELNHQSRRAGSTKSKASLVPGCMKKRE
jgi:hypothetical protein